jgi:hypothetical protein
MDDPRDLSGVWYGRYAADHGEEDNGFIAHLEELGGVFSGTISEPDRESGGIRRADVSGVREGATIRFVKQYDGTGGWVHAVHYAGQVDVEGVEVAGSWIVEGLTGGFDMQRDKFDANELEDEVEEEVLLGDKTARPF